MAALVAAGVIGAAGLAQAQDAVRGEGQGVHVLAVQLPGGGVEQIEYTGPVPPRVVLIPQVASLGFAPDFGAFAAFDRMAAQMDREMAAMLRQAQFMTRQALAAPGLTEAGMQALPPGMQGYSAVSVFTGNGVCTRSVAYTAKGQVAQSFGNCAGLSSDAPRPAAVPADPAAAHPQPQTLRVMYQGRPVGSGPIRG